VVGDSEGSAAEGSDEGAGAQAGARVTFIELGSDSCVPCKQMRPVMGALGRTFGEQLEIVYHDVWQDEAAARSYGVQYIPTQVFLDGDGVEFHRHVGFYPEEQIEALLLERGLKKSGR
jgi:thioredoxin 1